MDDLKKAVNAPERLIDGSELMKWLQSKIRECVMLNAHAESATTEEIIRYVKHMPAVEAVPVVHGRIVKEWSEGWVHYQVCSECRESWSGSGNYCPNCGAKMDGERRDDDGSAG